MRVIYWGTYDLGKPRNRILIRGLKENGIDLVECHYDPWTTVEDKSQIKGLLQKLKFLLRWFLSYPALIWRYLRLPSHQVVVIGYLGQLDVLILWPFAKIRGVPVVWDAFLSLYDTVVLDRKMVGRYNPLALFLYGMEWLACRAADLVILDTRAHADYFVQQYNLPEGKTEAVFVGAESECFAGEGKNSNNEERNTNFTLLFYGQFIPLHGITTIIQAAQILEQEPIDWIIIGQGQEETRIRKMLSDHPLERMTWIPWVEYEQLKDSIAMADLCLGIFGDTAKAGRVIPNKVFQVIAAGKPLITRDSAAIRELLDSGTEMVSLVHPADPEELATKIKDLATRQELLSSNYPSSVIEQIQPFSIGRQFANLLQIQLELKNK